MQHILSSIVLLLYEYATNLSFLILAAIGLIVIFGMMGVINMAHGELMMVGAFATSYLDSLGLPFPLALVCAAIAVGLFGIVLERLVVRHFYGRLLMSLVATWGLSLIISQGFLLLFGASAPPISTPTGNFHYEGLGYSYYQIAMFLVAFGLVALLWLLLHRTRYGIRARAAMENAEIAGALGVNTTYMYALTFGLGSALAGFAGGLIAPLSQVGPFFGQNYTPLAFITVVAGGGANVITGLMASALSLGAVSTGVTHWLNLLLGDVAMLVTAFVIIRILPTGISDYLERRKLRTMRR